VQQEDAEGSPRAPSEIEKRERLHKLIGEFDTAMLVTRTTEGALRARPLGIVKGPSDGRLYFSTAIESGKAAELEGDARVAVCLQDIRRFVSVSGVARIERGRALIDRLWSESWRIWFPKGKEDPSLCVLVVEPTDAEYWDLTVRARVVSRRGSSPLRPEAGTSLTPQRQDPRPSDRRPLRSLTTLAN